jgi:mxaD protein
MRLITAILAAMIATTAYAHGPTPRKTDESIVVNAMPDVLWQKISEPCAIASWHPEVAKCEAADKKRTLTLKNGAQLVEEVDEVATQDMTIAYRLSSEVDIAALPVSSLTGKIKIQPKADGTHITWMARYYRAFTGNEPPEGQDDEAAQAAVDAYVKAGLEGLTK